RIDYERADGEGSTYRLLPRRLIWYHGRLWLEASDAGQPKLFDVAGITDSARIPLDELNPSVLASGKDRGPATVSIGEEEDLFENAFGIFAGNYPVETIDLKVTGSWATYLRRYRIHPSQLNEESPDALLVRLRVGLCPEFKSFLMGMIPDVEVEGPETLREELRLRVARWARKMA
ncbi:MAG: WYL domain-containing protein, partial [Bradymonadaceae bacterium]